MIVPLVSFLLCIVEIPSESLQVKRARELLDSLVKNEFDRVVDQFGPRLKEKMPKEKLQEVWGGITKQLGAVKKVVSVKQAEISKHQVIDLTCQFEKMTLDVRFSLNQEGKVEGFFLRPTDVRKFETPSYAVKEKFREETLEIGPKSDWPLPATITLPTGKGPFPGVVLVHGSGPQDRDETFGPNKPFRDLAWGLASRGVAVLRFEKRTREHAAKLGDGEKITLKEEVIDDALAAIKQIREHSHIRSDGVFLLGHSLGAMAGPRIAVQDGHLAGLILLAGNSRPLEELIGDQFTYLHQLNSIGSENDKAELAGVLKKVERIRKGKYEISTPRKELPLDIPGAYWKYLGEYQPITEVSKLKTSLLILQGERDYQVTMEDFAGWKKGLIGRPNVTMKSYPNLNHFFMEGKGKSRPEEYHREGHVAESVIVDIAKWIISR